MEPQAPPEGLQPRQGSDGLVARIAERLTSANVRTVFGDPVDRDGTTVIPVASVRYGFGGGSGEKAAREPATGQQGSGGGGGVQVTPVGYIEMAEGEARFRRIRPARGPLRMLGFGLGALLFARGVAELLRQWRLHSALAEFSPAKKLFILRRLAAARGE
jgi:uncharacterized spore protein YtfJ